MQEIKLRNAMFGQRTGAGIGKGLASHVGQSAASTSVLHWCWALRNSLRLVNDINRIACLKCGRNLEIILSSLSPSLKRYMN